MRLGGVSLSNLSLAEQSDGFRPVDGIAVGGGRALFDERFKEVLDLRISGWSDTIRV